MIILDVKDVYKSFKVYDKKIYTLKDFFLLKNNYRIYEVLKGISFQLEEGEMIAIIGKNGSGKSTLLKIISQIIYPDKGTIVSDKKVVSLLELGAGFDDELTGRENIYLNASIYGLNKREVDKIIEDIVDFSEIKEYINFPVRTYSSGMKARLAFSIAINVKTEILILDEILSVGDGNFRNKCFNKIKEIKEKGTSIILVSHELPSLEEFCERTIWIKDGKIELEGKTKNVVESYEKFLEKE